jgi:hypothetical protein
MVCCLFLYFEEPSEFGCYLLVQEMSPVLCTCPSSGSSLSPIHCQPSCLSSHLFTDSSYGEQLLASSPLSGEFSATLPPSLCSLFTVQFFFFFFFGQGVSLPMGYAGLPQVWLGNTMWCMVLTCLVCAQSFKHICSWNLVVAAAPPILSV